MTLAALQALKNGNDPILVVTSADQTVQNTEAFIGAMQSAVKVADSGAIVILGIKPTGPETGFGYIKQSGAASNLGDFNVAKFVEKPDLETARAYLDSGDYSWNGGMFVVRASIWIKALNTFWKDILTSTENAYNQSKLDQHFIRPNHKLFLEIPSDSVDYAVIDKCPGSEFEIRVIPLNAGWNDLGAWDALSGRSVRKIRTAT